MTDLRFLEIDYDTAPVEGDLARYNATTGLWEPANNAWVDFSGSATVGAGAPMTISASNIVSARYLKRPGEKLIHYEVNFTCTTATTNGNAITLTLPAAMAPARTQGHGCIVYPGAGSNRSGHVFIDTTPKMSFYLYDAGNYGLGADRQVFSCGCYEGA